MTVIFKILTSRQTDICQLLLNTVHSDDIFNQYFISTLLLVEDKKLVRICLLKGHAVAENCWESLLVGKYKPDPLTYDEMEQKVTLQRFQLENPGFDFSGANITGNYHKGGPQFPSH
ncbi:hypothetical protein FSP39_007855 [Pinctada imbricata]|uniref:Uncharacterized protein n=1 Tax=Pinctada imbricata TaxID=66713 RepID=A0AA88YHU0_PINIB|nr:hypothetical protein FSP39_007855 [Pinctada imbricata]